MRRLGQPEEIARCVVFLAADGAGFVTEATLSANGGQFDDLGGTPRPARSMDPAIALTPGTVARDRSRAAGSKMPRGTGERTGVERRREGHGCAGTVRDPQTTPDHMDYPADHTPVVHARNTTRPREKGSMRLSWNLSQPELKWAAAREGVKARTGWCV